MAYLNKFSQNDNYRREELIRIIEHSVEKLTLQELEALYYDMSTKSYINDWIIPPTAKAMMAAKVKRMT